MQSEEFTLLPWFLAFFSCKYVCLCIRLFVCLFGLSLGMLVYHFHLFSCLIGCLSFSFCVCVFEVSLLSSPMFFVGFYSNFSQFSHYFKDLFISKLNKN